MADRKREPVYAQLLGEWRAKHFPELKSVSPLMKSRQLAARIKKADATAERGIREAIESAFAAAGWAPPSHARSIDHTREDKVLETTGFELRNLAGEIVFAEVDGS